MNHYQYLALMAASVAVTMPLELVLGARVYRRVGRVAMAIAIPLAAVYAADVVAIRRGLWTFDSRYVTGVRLPGSVPLEEAVFFLVIPLCTLLTFEAVRAITGRGRRGRA